MFLAPNQFIYTFSMDKQEFLKKELLADIELATNQIANCYDEIIEAHKLPNSCAGLVFEDGVVCENDDYKMNALECYQHQMGYYTCLKNKSKEMLSILNMDDAEFAAYLNRQEAMREQNTKTLENIKNKYN